MDNELMQQHQMDNAIQTIQVIQGSVVFGSYHELKNQATELADQIRTVEVNEDNVKLSKKLLAEVNKRVKTLEDRRIAIKKEMLEPYQTFEDQVKEIVGIVKDADQFVRGQVKDLEEQERLQKETELRSLWDKRIEHYSFKDFVPFLDFAEPRHLNKSTTIQAVEKEMVQFLEKVESDMKVIYALQDVDDHINAYLNTYDLGQAMTIVKNHQERKAQIEKARPKPSENVVQKLFHIVLTDQKDLKMVQMFMDQNDINYTLEG
jgi:biotin-(acetyl-CoA carboxylase) ligase